MESSLAEDEVYRPHVGTFQHLRVADLALPLNVQDTSQPPLVKVVKLFLMPPICGPGFTTVPNQEILRRAELTGIEAMLNQAQLRWSGHVTRMDDSRLPKQLFHAELSTGKRHKGGQKKWYKDVLKSTLKAYNIPVDKWQALAQDRPAWRAAIRKSTNHFERSRLQSLDEKRSARKNSAKP